MSLIKAPFANISAPIAIALLATLSFALANAQTATTSPNATRNGGPSINQTQSISSSISLAEMQQLVNTTSFENKTIGNLINVSHVWSEVMQIPPQTIQNILVLCNGINALPFSGGFHLGSQKLQVMNSHLFINSTKKSSGWMVTVYNPDPSVEGLAMADVVCVSAATTQPQQQEEAQMPTPPSTSTTVPQQQQHQSQQATTNNAINNNNGEEPITVKTDKASYSTGDTITISGTVKERQPGYSVTIKIIDPNSKQVVFTFTPVTANNQFKLSFDADNSGLKSIRDNLGNGPMSTSGDYLVTASYGIDSAETTFEFTAH